jgi:hypothetical protein
MYALIRNILDEGAFRGRSCAPSRRHPLAGRSRGTDVPVRIFSYSPFSIRAECVIPDAKSICSRRSSGSNRSNRFGNRDRHRYLHWVFEAKKRFCLCVLDYMVTSNHIHLLIKDTGSNVIAQSMQLAAGRTVQEIRRQRNCQGEKDPLTSRQRGY